METAFRSSKARRYPFHGFGQDGSVDLHFSSFLSLASYKGAKRRAIC